jgi:hypothetical protein
MRHAAGLAGLIGRVADAADRLARIDVAKSQPSWNGSEEEQLAVRACRVY